MPPQVRVFSGVGGNPVAIPAATQIGDLMIAFCGFTPNNNSGTINSIPAGWTQLYNVVGNNQRLAVAWRIKQAGDANPTWGQSSSGPIRTAILSIFDHDSSNPIDSSGQSASGGQSPRPSGTAGTNNFTPSVADELIIGATCIGYYNTTASTYGMTVLGGSGPAFTQQGWGSLNSGNSDLGLAVHTGNTPAGTSAIGARNWDYSATSGEWRSWTGLVFGIRPASPRNPIQMLI